MNASERIDQIVQQMDPNKLSKTLPQLYPLAIECEDYEGFVILFFWEKTLGIDKSGNAVQFDEVNHILEAAGLSNKYIENLKHNGFEKYLAMRYMEEGKVCPYSAREM